MKKQEHEVAVVVGGGSLAAKDKNWVITTKTTMNKSLEVKLLRLVGLIRHSRRKGVLLKSAYSAHGSERGFGPVVSKYHHQMPEQERKQKRKLK